MKNLENFGVQEMNIQEIKDANGGWWITISSGWFNTVNIYNPVLAYS